MAANIKVVFQVVGKGMNTLGAFEGRLMRFSKIAKSVFRSLTSLPALLGGVTFAGLARSTFKAGLELLQMNNRMKAATLNAQQYSAAMSFVNTEAERLGLKIQDVSNGFSGFAAAGLRAGLTFNQVKDIFSNVSEAAVAMQLPSNRVQLIFTALQQMASKGVVSMEELRRQLADSLPGALQIGARAMNMTTSEFIKLVSEGKVLSSEFLPKFAVKIREELGGSFSDASKQIIANMNRAQNRIFSFKAFLTQRFLPEINNALGRLLGNVTNTDVAVWVTKVEVQIRSLGAIWTTAWSVMAGSVDFVLSGLLAIWRALNLLGAPLRAFILAWQQKDLSSVNILINAFDELKDGFNELKAVGGDFNDRMVERGAKTAEAWRKVDEAMEAGAQSIINADKAVGESGLNNLFTGDEATMAGSGGKTKKTKEEIKKEFDWYPSWMRSIADDIVREQDRIADNAKRTADATKEAFWSMALSINQSMSTIVSSTIKNARKRQFILAAITMAEGIAMSVKAAHEAWKSKGTGEFYQKLATAIAVSASTVASTVAAVASIRSQKFAKGTISAPGGLAMINERGPELVNLPRGAQVFTAGQTQRMIQNTTDNSINGGITFQINDQVTGSRLIKELRSGRLRDFVVDLKGQMALV